MRNVSIAAALLLIVQLALVVVTHTTGKTDMSAPPEAPLVQIDTPKVTELDITDDTGQHVTLVKEGEKWILPQATGIPADQAAVTTLIDKMAGLRRGFVVSSSTEAAKRFQVSTEDFERHLVIREGETVTADIFIGTSPSYRQAHVRAAQSSDIMAVNLAAYELWPTIDQWLDKTMLAIDKEKITGIDFPDFSLVKEDPAEDGKKATWRLADGTPADPGKVKELIDELGLLTVQKVDKEGDKEKSLDQPSLTFSVTTGDKKVLTFRLAPTEKEEVLISRSDMTPILVAGKAVLETLQKFDATTLSGQPSPPETEAPQAPQENIVAPSTSPIGAGTVPAPEAEHND